jgi:PLP dependent protein
MAVVAYLRVSTEKQFLENQREEIVRFAERNGMSIDKWYTETVSGSVSSKERKLSGVLDKMRPGDSLIVTEISRLSRTLLEIMTILNSCIKKGVILYSTKEGYVFQNDINSKVLGFAFGLMAEIERNLISMRTKEALARRKQEGKHLGRKKGDMPKMKILAENKKQLLKEQKKGTSCSELARRMGESKVQEMTAKYESLPKDIEWHFIGHLQTNKIKYIVPYVTLIHGVDSYKLLTEINRQAAKAGRTVNCLLQLHIAQEETKFGFSFDECREMLAGDEWKKLGNVRICGLMGMATNTDNIEQIKAEFRSLNNFFQEAKATWFSNAEWFRELSMGMSHDYHEAIAAGSTLVRVGSKIFGERIY